jgi:predicted nucleotidyltransferase component of viral defense system
LLQRKAVEKHTFSLLEELMDIDFLKEFSLVGGTALALRLGHRKSIDIDLFNTGKFDLARLKEKLSRRLGDRASFHSSEKNRLGIFGYFEGIKLDLCKHPYPLLKPVEIISGIRMWSLEDIAASKVYAIAARATKKDFWDMDILLDHFSVEEIAGFYDKRYKQVLAISIAKMLTYFDEANDSDTPVCLLGKTWSQVKKSISKKINKDLK